MASVYWDPALCDSWCLASKARAEKVTTFSDFITNEFPDFAYISEGEQDDRLKPLLSQMSSCSVHSFITNRKRIKEVTMHQIKSLREQFARGGGRKK